MKIEIKAETELEDLMIPLLIDHFDLVIFKKQVPDFQLMIDAAAIDRAGKTYSFEFKLHDWKGVIVQAYKHLGHFDYNYICMPHAAIATMGHPQRIEKIQWICFGHGIGCMLYGRGILIPTFPAFPPGLRQSKNRLWKPSYNNMKEYLESDRGQIVLHRRIC